MPDPIDRISAGVRVVLHALKVFVIALACTLGMLGAMGAFVGSMMLAADLTRNEAGMFIPPALLLFGLLYGLVWSRT